MFSKKIIRSAHGFTLLELGIAMFIILLLVGTAIPAISSMIAENRLRQSAKELQLYAMTARRQAMLENRVYEIVLTEKGFVLGPYLAEENKGAAVNSYNLPTDARYTLQRLGDKEFHPPEGAPWLFQPDGLCEPIRARFQREKSWMEFEFNPLTAKAQGETDYFP